jgi:hypothetical protein
MSGTPDAWRLKAMDICLAELPQVVGACRDVGTRVVCRPQPVCRCWLRQVGGRVCCRPLAAFFLPVESSEMQPPHSSRQVLQGGTFMEYGQQV